MCFKKDANNDLSEKDKNILIKYRKRSKYFKKIV